MSIIIGVFLWGSFSLGAIADCGHPQTAAFAVAKVSDGDTLKLTDGRSVRVLGVNAPEITQGPKRGQPLGKESLVSARQFIAKSNGKVRLGFDAEKRDHYGRWLAHVYDISGRSLAVEQIRRGMAIQISVPPNLAQDACLTAVEKRARKIPKGVWRNAYWANTDAKALGLNDTGFRVVRGMVTRVDAKSSVWIEFDGQLVANIKKFDLRSFKQRNWQSLIGKTVEVRGWIKSRPQKNGPANGRIFKPLVMGVRAPSSFKVID